MSDGFGGDYDTIRDAPLQFFEKHDTQLSYSYGIMQTEMRKAVYLMKMERLIGILSILLQREKVTAPELTEKLKTVIRLPVRRLL